MDKLNPNIFRISNEPELRELWRKYQLSAGARLYATLSLVLLLIILRNAQYGFTYQPMIVLLLLFTASAFSGIYLRHVFYLLSRCSILYLIPIFTWTYLQWSPDTPPPVLIHCIYLPLIVIFLDNLLSATIVFLYCLLLIIYTAFSVPMDSSGNMQLMLVIIVTSVMIYAGAVVLWYTLISLFRRHEVIRHKLRNSLNMRKTILVELISSITPPLKQLSNELNRAEVDWQQIKSYCDQLNLLFKGVRQSAAESTKIYGKSLDTLLDNLQLIGKKSWQYLIISGFSMSFLMIFYFFFFESEINLRAVTATFLCGILYLFSNRVAINNTFRAICIYGLMALIIWTCLAHMQEDDHMFQIMYATVLILGVSLIFNFRQSLIFSALTLLTLSWWYVQTPAPSDHIVIIRSNIFYAIVYISILSAVFRLYLNKSLTRVLADEQLLLQETDNRYCLLATLFHDAANPLVVINGIAELRSIDVCDRDDITTLRAMVVKIFQLVELAQQDDSSIHSDDSLTLSTISVKRVIEETAMLFEKRLSDKNIRLELALDKAESKVFANPIVLSLSVLSNLMTNAIKFSPAGSTIRLSTKIVDGKQLCITLQDGGQGIPPEVKLQLEKGQYVESKPGTAGEIGSGHGLRLASLYVKQMKGVLKLDTNATVSVTLPLAA